MERSMTGCYKTFIYLTNNDIKWNKAERIILYAQKPNNKRQSNAKEWPQPPTLDEVLKCLNETCGSCEIDSELLDDVQIMFDGKSKPLKDFIFIRFDFGEIGTYIYYYGTWLEMTADYLYPIETDFTQLLSDNFMKAKQQMTSHWCHGKWFRVIRQKSGTVIEYTKYQTSISGKQWKEHFESICKDKHFKNIDMEGSVKLNDDGNIKAGSKLIIRQRAGNLKVCNAAVQLHLLHQCRLTEADFNASHALLNKLLYGTEVSMIICDRKEPHGIELSDILIWKDNTTYFVHVKSGFTGSAIREVCSQIRNSTDHIYWEQYST